MVGFIALPLAFAADIPLFDQPTSTGTQPPANLLLTPSVEFPTAITYAHSDASYNAAKEYIGYFDPKKCYEYNSGERYFEPGAMATGTNHTCSGRWSGNALNYGLMRGIDTFRMALTGGYRLKDGVSTSNTAAGQGVTVLQVAYQGATGNSGNRTIPTPYGDKVSRDKNLRNEPLGLQANIGDTLYEMAVRVCDNRKGANYLEANCKPYTNGSGVITYKPEGLIQEYQAKIRFGVFSYLSNDFDAVQRDGAVLRARMKNVGQLTWDGNTNTNHEWDPMTGRYVTNPDSTDASASGVTGSGVINYLNKFGFTSEGYMTNDQPSEMIAEALRYLRHKSPTLSYYNYIYSESAWNASKLKDGFPVITKWTDPILNGCQKNVILGIGDKNTHAENNFGDLTALMGGEDPKKWTEEVVRLEKAQGGAGVGGEPWGADWTEPSWQWGYDVTNPNSIPYTTYPGINRGGLMMAGMMYWAHTRNIRPDLKIPAGQKVTVDFFWVDVLENQVYAHKNQYWLAAKYGGFKDVNNNGVFDKGTDIWNAQGRTHVFGGSNPLPDNFYTGSNAKDMVSGLKSIFDQVSVLSTVQTGTGAVIEDEGRGDDAYKTSYDTKDWSGEVTGLAFNGFKADGSLNTTTAWNASAKIDAQNWNTERKIVTKQGVGGAAVPFRWAKLTTAQKTALGNNEAVLNYLRGNRANEGTIYRARSHVLGDIVNATPVLVAAPNAQYLDAVNPGYAAFQNLKQSRQEMLYVAANDGMLHALNAKGTNGGREHWAYVPSFLYNGPSAPPSPQNDGLLALSRKDYTHHYYVDATPVTADVDFNRVANGSGNITYTTATPSNWHTILVGGLGKGGKGFYALDVTDPPAITASEDIAAGKVLWEFTDTDMGFSYGEPLIVKTKAWGWVVIFSSGYNNASGKGAIYIVNAATGKQITKKETPAGSGLAQISAYYPIYGDYTATEVYGGDLDGNVWRFALPASGTTVGVHRLATLANGNGQKQPVTVAPFITRPKDGKPDHRWVFVGTGRFLADSDITKNTGAQVQTLYALRDGSQYATESSYTTPLTRANLSAVTNLTTGLASTPDKGWYHDMTGDLNGAKERVWKPMSSAPGVISWTGVMPGIPESCNAAALSGKSRVYAVGIESGKSVLGSAFIDVDALLTSTQLVYGADGEIGIVGTGTEGDTKLLGKFPVGDATRRILNWRLLR
ncbi:hypothetical protein AGMMS50289_16570 [Betaproteobacteria bacterium]|nr:hypothetical protein AGMMS50289_16570 [Betaproteobacteria bacterium]